ncbi:MAG: CFI-box-CTERM domain-containing protein [Verrucomicrobiota bacterium]
MESINRRRFCAIALGSAAAHKSLIAQSSGGVAEGHYSYETKTNIGNSVLNVRTYSEYDGSAFTVIRDEIDLTIDSHRIRVECSDPAIESRLKSIVSTGIPLFLDYTYGESTDLSKGTPGTIWTNINIGKDLQRSMMQAGFERANQRLRKSDPILSKLSEAAANELPNRVQIESNIGIDSEMPSELASYYYSQGTLKEEEAKRKQVRERGTDEYHIAKVLLFDRIFANLSVSSTTRTLENSNVELGDDKTSVEFPFSTTDLIVDGAKDCRLTFYKQPVTKKISDDMVTLAEDGSPEAFATIKLDIRLLREALIKARPLREKNRNALKNFKGTRVEEAGGECFITTACCDRIGLPDDCWEMETLRRYRDTYLLNSEHGAQLVKDYYALSPVLLPALSATPGYLSSLYRKMILPCALLACLRLNWLCLRYYSFWVRRLVARSCRD